jgi:hypothetical protein
MLISIGGGIQPHIFQLYPMFKMCNNTPFSIGWDVIVLEIWLNLKGYKS